LSLTQKLGKLAVFVQALFRMRAIDVDPPESLMNQATTFYSRVRIKAIKISNRLYHLNPKKPEVSSNV